MTDDTHNYHFGYSKTYADHYENIFRKKRNEADDEQSSEAEGVISWQEQKQPNSQDKLP